MGAAVGWPVGLAVGCLVGLAVGPAVGAFVGVGVGFPAAMVGPGLGAALGTALGTALGEVLGTALGCDVGCEVGCEVGSAVGFPAAMVGCAVGARDGLDVGRAEGCVVGVLEGAAVGLTVGGDTHLDADDIPLVQLQEYPVPLNIHGLFPPSLLQMNCVLPASITTRQDAAESEQNGPTPSWVSGNEYTAVRQTQLCVALEHAPRPEHSVVAPGARHVLCSQYTPRLPAVVEDAQSQNMSCMPVVVFGRARVRHTEHPAPSTRPEHSCAELGLRQ